MSDPSVEAIRDSEAITWWNLVELVVRSGRVIPGRPTDTLALITGAGRPRYITHQEGVRGSSQPDEPVASVSGRDDAVTW